MLLSKNLTYLIFSVLLVTTLAFVAAPAMAVVVEGTYEVAYTAPAVALAGPPAVAAVQGSTVVTFKFNQAVTLTKADITSADADSDGSRDALADAVEFAGSGSEYTLTFKGPADGTGNPAIPGELTLTGYGELTVTNADAAAVDLALAANHLAGNGFLIIGNHTNRGTGDTITTTAGEFVVVPADGAYPTMPDHGLPADANSVRRSQWATHGVTDAPDLFAHFQLGQRGTIGLDVIADADPDNPTAARPRIGDANARTVVINEVMWARDESQVGNPLHTREQWIEVHNRSSLPVDIANIKLTFVSHPANPDGANAYTDRLSNYPNFTTVWDITGKGQDGSAGDEDNNGEGKVTFVSMARTKLDNGWTAGHWGASGELFLPNFRGTPNRANAFAALPGARQAPGADSAAKATLVINEIGNMGTDKYDWVEIKNISSDAVALKTWALSSATAFDNEAELFRFPDKSLAAGGILLLVNSDPATDDRSPLAVGNNINLAAADQAFGADGNVTYYVVPGEALEIPNDNNWLLILRSGNPWDVKDGRNVYNSGFRVEDIAGAARIVKLDLNVASPAREKKADGAGGGDIWQTTHFPLNGLNIKPEDSLATNRNLGPGTVFARNTGKQGYVKEAFNQVGYTGVGYKRNTSGPENGGTPGYDNGVAKGKVGDVADGGLIVSELMLTTDNGRNPQWIELHNTSKTSAINVAADGSDPKDGWQIKIENHNSGSWDSETRPLNVTINLKDWFGVIPPNQTVLIVSTKGRNSESDHFPDTRVAGIFESKKDAFKMANRRDIFLNATGGFRIDIVDGDGAVSDSVGNLDGKAFNAREGIGLDDPVGFDWPTDLVEGEDRTSLIRIRDAGVPRVAIPTRDEDGNATDSQGGVVPMGQATRPAEYAWVHAVDTALANAQDSWYGSQDDFGTPLHTAGTPLPVSLSHFRPTLENGQVVIRWTTESELDNAGFNILRSDTRNGEYKQVNSEMIQGNGTTGERSTYKWVDASAKPNVVYYYQIEDVSFAGERQTLQTTKLKGLISAVGKATTTWGDIKEVQ